MKRFKKYISCEIGIEFKACLYFCMILFFYFLYCISKGSFYANIILMAEMVCTVYLICYIQVFLLNNFDEAERLGKSELFAVFLCTASYTAASYFFNWYGRNITATVFFFSYILFCYLCVFLAYKIKRNIDTVLLNQELENYKNRKEKNGKDV